MSSPTERQEKELTTIREFAKNIRDEIVMGQKEDALWALEILEESVVELRKAIKEEM